MTQALTKRPLGAAFVNLFTANIASSLGDGIARIAVPLLAVQVTTDPFLISGIAALVMLPWLLFAIPSGILIDRIDRRLALAIASSVRTVLALTLFYTTATGQLTIWWLYAIVFVYGAFETLYDGAIRAVVPAVISKAQLPRANSLIEAGEQVVQNFVAGPFTSMLFAVSALIPLGANAAVFAIAIALAFVLPRAASGRQFSEAHARSGAAATTWRSQFADGYRFIVSNRMLLRLWLVSTGFGLLLSASNATIVLYLIEYLGMPEAWFGVFLLAGALGALAASAITSSLKVRLGAGPTMAVSVLFTAAGTAFIGMVPALWAAAVGFFVSSMAVTTWNILVMSLRQSAIPGRLLGRVHGTWRTLLWGTMPVGSLIGGLVSSIELWLPYVVFGGAALVLGVINFRFIGGLPNPEDIDNGDDAELAGGLSDVSRAGGTPDAPRGEAGEDTSAGPTAPHIQD